MVQRWGGRVVPQPGPLRGSVPRLGASPPSPPSRAMCHPQGHPACPCTGSVLAERKQPRTHRPTCCRAEPVSLAVLV